MRNLYIAGLLALSLGTTQCAKETITTHEAPRGTGRSLLSGQGAPNDSVGQKGDRYIDVQNLRLYGPKGDLGWGGNFVALKGPKGVPGAGVGQTGDPGDKGPQGDPGDKGPQGDPGAAGEKGPKGTSGNEPGAQGDPGPKGAKGDQGQKGTRGDKGPQGTPGAAGERGEQGAQGEPGDPGQPGGQGEQGDTGESTSFFQGNGAPAPSQGKINDFYYDKSGGVLYGPKTSSGWGTGLTL
ncbi:hypothetical protein [uncultured Capnocytophaga sp.]|uniref:hypothetical protein n=1 Tax=uncultured Capnocytophaga sp. TaxID=159273 RepID=UPI00261D10D8|nr:hypothetical protein [uncultured Capnocytophaga sp.]